jgi:hypothetical protein
MIGSISRHSPFDPFHWKPTQFKEFDYQIKSEVKTDGARSAHFLHPGKYPDIQIVTAIAYGIAVLTVKPPRGKPRGILKGMAELSIAISPPSLKLRRALLAIHPRGKPRGILAKESKRISKPGPWPRVGPSYATDIQRLSSGKSVSSGLRRSFSCPKLAVVVYLPQWMGFS